MLNEAEIKVAKERLECDQSSATSTEGTIHIYDPLNSMIKSHLLLSEGRGQSGQQCVPFMNVVSGCERR